MIELTKPRIILILFLTATRLTSAAPHKVFIPQIGDGVGWRTQINISFTGPTEGSIEFFDSLGNPTLVQISHKRGRVDLVRFGLSNNRTRRTRP